MTIICVVISGALAVVNGFTAPVSAANAAIREDEARRAVVPEAAAFEKIEGVEISSRITAAYAAKNMSDKTIHEAASRLVADSKVSARLAELRKQTTKETIMSAQKRLEWLTGLIEDKDVSIGDKLRAADIMNKMQGEYIQKVEAAVTNAVNINIELSDD